jgi:hypothetical protein
VNEHDKRDCDLAVERKAWRTPVVITSQIEDTEAGALPVVPEGSFANGS